MQTRVDQQYAVLTGDIVGSRRLTTDEWQSLAQVIDRLSVDLSHWPEVPLPLARFRGDGWQLLVSDPRQALRVALYIRATLRAEVDARQLDTRVAIGVGRIDPLPGARVSEGTGPAYWRSGTAEDKKGWQRLRFAIN